MISEELYDKTREFVEKKAYNLWIHENEILKKKNLPEKNMFQYGFNIDECFCYELTDVKIIFLLNTFFLKNINTNIVLSQNTSSELFGTGNALDVLSALFNNSRTLVDFEQYILLQKDFACCYVVFMRDGNLEDEVLRIDMFRKLDQNKQHQKKKDFTGGLLHILKHYSIKGKNLSVGNDKNDVDSIDQILIDIARAFICKQSDKRCDTDFVSVIDNNNNHKLKVVFYREVNTNVYFIKTSHITKH